TVFIGSFLQSSSPNQGVLFLAVVGGLFVLWYRILGASLSELSSPLSAALLGIACAVVVVVVWLSEPALQSLWDFCPQVQALFALQYRLWWLLGALAGIAFART